MTLCIVLKWLLCTAWVFVVFSTRYIMPYMLFISLVINLCSNVRKVYQAWVHMLASKLRTVLDRKRNTLSVYTNFWLCIPKLYRIIIDFIYKYSPFLIYVLQIWKIERKYITIRFYRCRAIIMTTESVNHTILVLSFNLSQNVLEIMT